MGIINTVIIFMILKYYKKLNKLFLNYHKMDGYSNEFESEVVIIIFKVSPKIYDTWTYYNSKRKY